MSGEEWFASRGWTPFDFQRDAWAAYRRGESGLIHASTGTGKTYAAFLGPLSDDDGTDKPPLTVLWLTPLRALSTDTAVALQHAVETSGSKWDVGIRTGDTPAAIRTRQKKRLPTVLVTTPESLALFLSHDDARERFANLKCVIVDEWHELLGSKRGVLAELGLARLRRFQTALRIWGLSATLGNLDEARDALLSDRKGVTLQGRVGKTIVIDAVLPPKIERFPWAGHLGLSLLPQVVEVIESARSVLCFTNTRSQTEIWYRAILDAKPEWAGQIALHHGSLDRKTRDWVEDHLRSGTLRCVVCTSSLDLGVDFSPVDRVVQIGSPKGVARLLQRAGRSGHQPGAVSRVTCVPTNAFELIEIAAARSAAAEGRIEARQPLSNPLDVLAQHAISCALAGGFRSEELLAEVRGTFAYRNLSPAEWNWVLDFITRGGDALKAYPEYRRVVLVDGVYRVEDQRIARRHRMAIGTISSEANIQVRFVRGGRLGTVEESFAARLKPRDRFTFAGRILEFVRFHEMTLQVRLSRPPTTMVPRWAGGRMPLSTELATAVRARIDEARRGDFQQSEMSAVQPILAIQARWSQLPAPGELLVERLDSREGSHLFLYPFEGRLVHEGLAALLAFRLARRKPQSFALAANDYGFELVSADPIERIDLNQLLSPESLLEDALESLNASELAKRQFREVARVAGLVHPGMPRAGRSAKQLQASSSLFYNVFREYDPENLLLWQSRREVLDRQFEFSRLKAALVRLEACRHVIVETARPTPFAFPLLVDRLRDTVSSEKLADRVRRMVRDLERQAGPP